MFGFKTNLLKQLTMLNNNKSIYNFRNINLINKFTKKNFNSPVPAGAGATPATQAPQKTKEQLKIEKLMESWPESIRNPQTEDMRFLKETLECIYKYHQGDKNYLKYYEIPEHVLRVVNSELYSALSTENIASFIKEKNGFLTDEMILYKFHQITSTHKDLTKEFYEIVLPEVKKCIANSDRQCNNILALAVVGGANASIGDREFWGLLVN